MQDYLDIAERIAHDAVRAAFARLREGEVLSQVATKLVEPGDLAAERLPPEMAHKDAAEFLGEDPELLRSARRDGKFTIGVEARKFGRTWVYSTKALLKLKVALRANRSAVKPK